MKHAIDLQHANANYLDWHFSLDSIPNKEESKILELGCGIGTQYLCNEFKEIYSFEVFYTREWFDISTQMLSKWDNWKGKFYTFDELDLMQAEKQLIESRGQIRNKEALNPFYNKLNEFVDLSTIDVVFVDQGFHFRAETINYFMSLNIPYIFAHDTRGGAEMYGWNTIIKNDLYDVKYFDSSMQGVTHWIKK